MRKGEAFLQQETPAVLRSTAGNTDILLFTACSAHCGQHALPACMQPSAFPRGCLEAQPSKIKANYPALSAEGQTSPCHHLAASLQHDEEWCPARPAGLGVALLLGWQLFASSIY